MPTSPRRPCPSPGCPNLQPCPAHQRMYDKRRGNSAARGYRADPGSDWQRKRRIVLARDPLCQWRQRWKANNTRGPVSEICTSPSVDVAHIVPKAQGGSDDPANLRGLCHRHHSQETATRESFGRGT